jgi:hypothetical protein
MIGDRISRHPDDWISMGGILSHRGRSESLMRRLANRGLRDSF